MANVFNIAKRNILDSTWNFTTETLEMALVTTGPAANLTATEIDYAHMSACEAGTFVEATTTNSARVALANLSYTTGTGTAGATFIDSTDVVFSSLEAVGDDIVGALILYSTTGAVNDSDVFPVAYYDLANTSPNGNDFTVVIGATGWLTLT